MFEDAFAIVKTKYNDLKRDNLIISSIETDQEYENRIKYEIFESKRIIEEKLNKKVEFLCWPHGDNNEFAHKLAMEAGYLATTVGSKEKILEKPDRIPERIGLFHSRNNRLLSILKARYKIGFFLEKFPWIQIKRIYSLLKN